MPLYGLAGAAVPGCECGSVPAAAALTARGVGSGPAVAFMLAGPSTNPVVLAATAAAFPGQPAVVAARFAAGLLVAVSVGLLAAGGVLGRPRAPAAPHVHAAAGGRVRRAATAAPHHLVRALALLVVGAVAAATITVFVPQHALAGVARHSVWSVVALAGLAVLLCTCSQADAFVARSFVGFSATAQFAYMIVGSAVDLKLVAMQAGAFGSRFAARLSAVTVLLALVVASATATVLL